METREEEIKQAVLTAFDKTNKAVNYTLDFIQRTVFNSGFYAGIEWADEHPKNPWRDAKKDPPKDGKPVIGIDKYGSICKYEYMPDEKMWAIGIGIFISDVPEYWMPIPELPKRGEE